MNIQGGSCMWINDVCCWVLGRILLDSSWHLIDGGVLDSVI